MISAVPVMSVTALGKVVTWSSWWHGGCVRVPVYRWRSTIALYDSAAREC